MPHMMTRSQKDLPLSYFADVEHELETVSAYLEPSKKLKLGKKDGANNDGGDDTVAGEKRPLSVKLKK